jgi:exonuclease SbcC
MKIKKIQIQAFKSYLFNKDGTFNFVIDSKEHDEGIPADLISLYAPNGFGKTSFYDAIDYAVTNNIGRYIRDGLDKQNKNQGSLYNQKGKKQYILRNRDADLVEKENKIKLETRIEIESTNRSFISKYTKPNNNNMDYVFDPNKSNLRTEYFSAVLLSQEAIDAFLREINPHARFNKFIENTDSELKKFNHKRIALNQMCREIVNRKSHLEDEIKGLITEYNKIESLENPFQDANDIVEELNKERVIFTDFPSPFLEEHQAGFDSERLVYTSQLEGQCKLRSTQKEKIINLLSEIISSQRKINENNQLETKLNNIAKAISDKKTISKLQNTIISNEDTSFSTSTEIEKLNDIDKQSARFIVYQTELMQLNKDLDKSNDKLIELQKTSTNHSDSLDSYREQEAFTNNSKDKLLKLKTDSNQVFVAISEIETKMSLEYEFLARLQGSQSKTESQLVKFSSNINVIKSFSIESVIWFRFEGNASELKNDRIITLNNFHNQFNKETKKHHGIEEEKKALSNQLNNIKSQNKAIFTLANKASEIVSDSNMSSCPVCQQQYDDVQTLQKKITSNPILNEIEKDLTTKQQLLIVKLNEHNHTLLSLRSAYNLLIDKMLNEELAFESEVIKTQDDCNIRIENVNKQLDLFDHLITQQRIKVLNKSSQEFEQYILSNNKDLDIKTRHIKSKSIEAERVLKSTRLDIQLTRDELVKLNTAIKSHQDNSEEWKDLFDFLDYNRISISAEKTIISSFISNKLSSQKDKLNNLGINKKNLDKEIQDIKSQINSHYTSLTLEDIIQKREKYENVILVNNQSLKEFNATLLILKANIPNSEEEWLNLIDKANETLVTTSIEEVNDARILQKIELLNELALQALNFCNRQMHQEAIDNKTAELSNHIRILEPLEEDLSNINHYIESTANKYFKTSLINQIYSSIDPHPEYKNISFECKVPNNDKAELNISLVNPDNDDRVSPNLHFSSAQINVLSLSIFLARALTATDDDKAPVNCIFIDDPIQSMDSINVLSLIDLFRNFCTRFGKQLIISTHDENFHELLKKKMPPSLFKSKFLRLVSFGKVEEDVV